MINNMKKFNRILTLGLISFVLYLFMYNISPKGYTVMYGIADTHNYVSLLLLLTLILVPFGFGGRYAINTYEIEDEE